MHPQFLSPYIKSKIRNQQSIWSSTNFKLNVCDIPQITLDQFNFGHANYRNNLLIIYHKYKKKYAITIEHNLDEKFRLMYKWIYKW